MHATAIPCEIVSIAFIDTDTGLALPGGVANISPTRMGLSSHSGLTTPTDTPFVVSAGFLKYRCASHGDNVRIRCPGLGCRALIRRSQFTQPYQPEEQLERRACRC
jgi:hypothetical protein